MLSSYGINQKYVESSSEPTDKKAADAVALEVGRCLDCSGLRNANDDGATHVALFLAHTVHLLLTSG